MFKEAKCYLQVRWFVNALVEGSREWGLGCRSHSSGRGVGWDSAPFSPKASGVRVLRSVRGVV